MISAAAILGAVVLWGLAALALLLALLVWRTEVVIVMPAPWTIARLGRSRDGR